MPKWAAIMLAFVLASPPPLQAAEGGSTELVRQCKYPRQGKRSIDENADALQCLSYINGFVAGASIVAGPRRFASRPQPPWSKKPMPTWPGRVSTPTC